MSRQVLVQRLLLPGNGNVNCTGQTNNNSIKASGGEIVTALTPLASTGTTTNKTEKNNSSEVPWNNSDKQKQQTTTEAMSEAAIATAAIASNQNALTPDERNATFLNALVLNDFEELPQSSTSQYQHYRDIQDQIRDNMDGPPSVDSAFDESSSKLEIFLSYT